MSKGRKRAQIEREFRDLDEVLIWVDRNQLGRRNLTDEQRAVVIGRLYKTVKKEPHRPTKEEKVENFTTFTGHAATARALAEQLGVSEKTVRNAEKFADAVEALQQVSPQAAERVLRGEVRDALTELPKVPDEMFSFVTKKHGLSFQVVEREFYDLDEVLIWVDRNQLGRRNLTDAERSIVRARIYEIKKKPRGRPRKEENVQNLDIFLEEESSDQEDTATEVAHQLGVSRATIFNDVKFKEAWERLQEISPKAAEIVLRDEVRDAKTELPKVPPEVLPFVALANFQRRPTSWAVTFALFGASPNNWRCPLTDSKPRWALHAFHNDRLNLPFPSRLQFADLPKRFHKRRTKTTHFRKMLQSCFEKQQVALVSLNCPKFCVYLLRLQRPVSDCFPNCFATATQLLRQLPNRQHRKSPRSGLTCKVVSKIIQPTQPQHFLSRCELLAFACVFATRCLNCVDL